MQQLIPLFNFNYILCYRIPLCTICGYIGDDTMTTEFNSEQNLAVCANEYDSHEEDSIENDIKKEIRKDV